MKLGNREKKDLETAREGRDWYLENNRSEKELGCSKQIREGSWLGKELTTRNEEAADIGSG